MARERLNAPPRSLPAVPPLHPPLCEGVFNFEQHGALRVLPTSVFGSCSKHLFGLSQADPLVLLKAAINSKRLAECVKNHSFIRSCCRVFKFFLPSLTAALLCRVVRDGDTIHFKDDKISFPRDTPTSYKSAQARRCLLIFFYVLFTHPTRQYNICFHVHCRARVQSLRWTHYGILPYGRAIQLAKVPPTETT